MTLIHEINAEHQHRIVQVKDDGTNKTGEWAEERDLATLDKWFANCVVDGGGLPAGVFTVKEVAYQVLA